MTHYHFVGISGSGMKPLAYYLHAQGHCITGSDRAYDTQTIQPDASKEGISIYPQNGSGINDESEVLVYSTAIEDDNPDILVAKEKNLNILHRSQLLAESFNAADGIAVSGTSGKTTTAAMCAYLLVELGYDPSFIIGGSIQYKTHRPKNWRLGKSPLFLIEADESDGSLISYKAKIGIILNISDDHKSLPELENIFRAFAARTQHLLITNADCSNTEKLLISDQKILRFSLQNPSDYQAHNISLSQNGSKFHVNGQLFELSLPGKYNIYNALAAIALSHTISDAALSKIAKILAHFPGVERRLEKIGKTKGIHVYDDYAHNPVKIFSAITTLQTFSKRLFAVYQPHGYGPLRMQFRQLVETFQQTLRPQDELFLLPIHDVGGRTDRNISSKMLAEELKAAKVVENRVALIKEMKEKAMKGDVIVVMGARDATLNNLSREILTAITDLRR